MRSKCGLHYPRYDSHNFSVFLLHILPLFCQLYLFLCEKIQSIDIILLHFTINVGLFRQVLKICYCDQFSAENESIYRYICTSFIESVKKCVPEQLKKLKVYLILHLVVDMKEFGPTASFNTERYVQKWVIFAIHSYYQIYIC